jgi:RNA polymerase I-specific transcription initiation factor RRN3
MYMFYRIIAIDVHIPREVLETMDEEGDDMETDEKFDDQATVFTMDDVSRSASKYSSSTSCDEFELAHTLDILMEQILSYIRDFCALDDLQSWNHHKALFKELLAIFEQQMLFVHGSHHVQFFMFYMCSLRSPTFAELFLCKFYSLF